MDSSDGPHRLGQPAQSSSILSSSSAPSSSPPVPYKQPQSSYHTTRLEVAMNEKTDSTLWGAPNHRTDGNTDTSPHPRGDRAHPHWTSPSAMPSTSGLQQASSPHMSHLPSQFSSTCSPYSSRTASSLAYTRPRGIRIANLLKPWIPIILYGITSLGFVVAIGLWKAEVFYGLDQLSQWLKSDELTGQAVIFFLIFITTFPPLPLYSTLMILSGYTFGSWTGAIISYFASLTGALLVFMISRTFFRASISHWLSCTVTIKRVVRAIEKRPKLLFLIRLAPYPFNVMNCLLAASPTLTLRTYMLCTAMSLFKVIIHTSIGSSIHSFAEYHVTNPNSSGLGLGEDESQLGHYSTIIGIALCVAIFIYLSYVARRAVDEELEDDDGMQDCEEAIAFLSDEDAVHSTEEDMAQAPFRSDLTSRPSLQQERS